MSYTQLEIFPISEEMEFRKTTKEINQRINAIEESCHKVRRGTYAQINKIGKAYCEQEQRISELEHKIWILEKFIRENLK